MKRHLFSGTIVLLLAFIALATYANIDGSPFKRHDDQRFHAIENLLDSFGRYGNGINLSERSLVVGDASGNANALAETADGSGAVRSARATYDVAVDGGSGANALGVSLPANSIILKSWFYVVTQFVDGGAGTVALSCEDADNLYVASDITGNAAGAIVAGAVDGGAASTFVSNIAAECELTATVAGSDQTAGKLILYVDYAVAE